METLQVLVDGLANWFAASPAGVRAFLERHAKFAPADRVGALATQLADLTREVAAKTKPLPVCFLGNSGVGKSTLINALVGNGYALLPAGGVGPLTALATEVKFAETPYFRAQYHGRQQLNKLLFPIEREHERELARDGKTVSATSDDVLAELSDAERAELEASLRAATPTPEGAPPTDRQREDALFQQATLLICGDQFARRDRAYVADGLRVALGGEPRWGSELTREDLHRARRIAKTVGPKRGSGPLPLKFDGASDMPAFLTSLGEHASGFLAPLIRELEVGWPHELLRTGIELVDLPGVGVANDDYRDVTARRISGARAVILVVDKSGMRDADAELLFTTPFVNSHLHEQGDDGDPSRLFVVMTKVDDVARAERTKEKQTKGKARPFPEIFESLCERGRAALQDQLAGALRRFVADSDGGQDARGRVVDGILESVQFFAVSAAEHRRFLDDDDGDRPSLENRSQTHIDDVGAALTELGLSRVNAWLDRQNAHALTLLTNARLAVDGTVERARLAADVAEEAKFVQAELDEFVKDLRSELRTRDGAFRNFLDETMPDRIRAGVASAADEARKAIKRRLKRYDGYPWQTVRAAIRRGGVFDGARNVDLPNELTLLFEEPVADVWSRTLLSDLRKKTREMSEDHVKVVEPILEWARGKGTKVRPKLVELLVEEIREETQKLSEVGRDAIADLKEKVKLELYGNVQKRVRARCEKFVEDNQDRGIGVKMRMLEFLDELSEEVSQSAADAARRVLERNYETVKAEIRDVFRKRANPIDRAVEAITAARDKTIVANAAEARGVLAEAQAVLDRAPSAVRAVVS